MAVRRIVTGVLSQWDLNLLQRSLARLWPLDETPCFAGLLQAIDEAENR